MKTVHILANKDQIINYTLAPIRHNHRQLLERGYAVEIFYKISDELFDCDILCLISKPTYGLSGETKAHFDETGSIVQLLQKARGRAGKIIWMDDSDSSTVTHFELLPYIDLYLKKQVFRDKALYKKRFYGGRIFSDYYHEKFGIEDANPYQQFFPLDDADWNKVQVSWNIGLGDMRNAFTWRNIVGRFAPDMSKIDYDVSFIDPGNERPVDLFLRTSANLSRETIAFHRREMLKRLASYCEGNVRIAAMVGDNVFAGSGGAASVLPAAGGKIPMSKYRNILANTKIVPSPFGWGEIGVRDYEAFIFGGTLLKPDMEHLDTWPQLFIAGETYVPIEWGFGDMEETIERLLGDDCERIRIATNGQEAYRQSISESGMEAFCEQFISRIEYNA